MTFLAHLPRYGEYPVPYIVQWIDGKPDFRVVDMDKWAKCVSEGLCSICGYKIGEMAFIIGGPLTAEQYLFFDPPMHKKCAEFSAEVCPYISGKKREFSNRPVSVPHDTLDRIQARNSDAELYIYTIRWKQMRVVEVDGATLLKARQILGRTLVRSKQG